MSQVRFNASWLGVSPVGGGLPLCLCARVQPRLRSLYQYTMCKRITEPVARTVGVSSELRGSLSGIGRLAAQPPLRESRLDECFDAPGVPSPKRWSVLKEPSVRIRRKGAFPAGVCGPVAAPPPGSVSQHGQC